MAKNLIRIDEVAKILNMKNSTLHQWTQQGLVPVIRIGRLLRFDPDEIMKYLQDGRFEKVKKDKMANKIRKPSM